LIGGATWAAPMAGVLMLLGRDHVLWRWACFLEAGGGDLGGAYAVLAYMAQQAVSAQHWLSAAEMADGLGLAETTPGPLIMDPICRLSGGVSCAGAFTPLVAGLLGAAPPG
jgi:chromate transporter